MYIHVMCFNSDVGRVNVGAAKAMQISASYKSNARVIHS